MSLPLARIDDQYDIVAKIKEGGMGEIYKVRHRLLDELRVVKVLHPSLEGDSELNERFAREARAAIRLRHPNIVQIFDFTLDDSGTGLIVMEYIAGTDLKQLIAQPRRPSVALAIEIARQSLRALGYLHRHGFVHRDVSPDNLMLSQDVEGKPLVKVIDLGIAKQRGAESQLTASGIFLGKFRYSSPEHFGVKGPGGIESRSDLYTFGLVLYELLTGHYPIRGDSTSQLIGGHLFQPPRGFAETDPRQRVPEALRQAVLKTLAKDPDERFPTAEALIERLDEIRPSYPLDGDVLEEARRFTEDAPADESNAIAADGEAPGSGAVAGEASAAGKAPADDEAPAIAGTDPSGAVAPAAPPLDALVTEVESLLDAGKLIEADRILFQARETHGPAAELSTMKTRLDELYQRGVETEVRALVARAEALTRDEDFTRALEILEKAQATAPPRSPLNDEVEAAATDVRRQRDARRQRRTIAEIERRLISMIQRQQLAEAREMLAAVDGELASDPAFSSLRELLTRTVVDHIQSLVQKAGVAYEDQRFEAAADCLHRVLELDPENTWIRDRLEEAEAGQERQEEDARRDAQTRSYLQQAQQARAGKDILKARLLVARALELRPDDPEAAELARALDREHRAAELQLSALRTTPLSPALMKAFTDIESLRARGDPVAAWRLLGEAIEKFGENETLTQLRRQIADEVLSQDDAE